MQSIGEDLGPATPRGSLIPTLATLLIGILLIPIAVTATANQSEGAARRVAETDAADIRRAIELRTGTIAELLIGLRSHLTPQAEVRVRSFQEYVTLLDPSRFPAVKALSFARAGPLRQVVIEHIYPVEGNEAAIGLDLADEANRRAAILRARDNDFLSATAPIKLVQTEGPGLGLLFVLPIYETGLQPRTAPERRRAFRGVATAAIEIDALIGQTLGVNPAGVAVYDAGHILDDASTLEPTRIYGSGDIDNKIAADINVADRRWRVRVPLHASNRPALVAGLIAALITILTAFLVHTRMRTSALRSVEAERAHLRQVNAVGTRLLSTVSHEMRTPLAAIRGFVTLLRDGHLQPGQSDDFLDRVERNAATLDLLIAELVDYQRLQREPATVRREAVNLADVVHSILQQLEPLRGARDIAVIVAGDMIVDADPAALGRIVTNLVTNAMKFSPERSPIDITARIEGDVIEFRIADKGPGIPADQREAVFEPFFRGSAPHVVRTQGTGIGLAVVKELLDQMGGTVAVEENPGGGARMVVSLPRSIPGLASDDAEDADGAA